MMSLLPEAKLVVAASALSGSVAVAIGALVVVLAIVLVFFMVLRSNGGSRKTASGLGYDAQRGPLGQPGGEGPGWRQGQQPGWEQPGEYAGGQQGARPGAGWGQTQDYPGAVAPGAPGQQGAAPRWSTPQAQGGWDEPAAQASAGAWGGAPADGGVSGEQWPPRQPGGWGAPQGQPVQQGRAAGGGSNGWDMPAQGPGGPPGGGWENAAQDPSAGGRWGAPAGGQPAAWGQAEQNAPAWSGPAQASAPREWSQPTGGGAAGALGGWGADAPQAAAPSAGAAAWGAPAASGPQGGFGDVDKTRIANPAAAGRSTSMVVVRQGKEPGRIFEMRKERMTIGRSRESDIFLEDLAVSRLHTTISRDPQGQFIIRDENSANGTYVNNQKITEHLLQEGDEIQVGQTVLSFVRR